MLEVSILSLLNSSNDPKGQNRPHILVIASSLDVVSVGILARASYTHVPTRVPGHRLLVSRNSSHQALTIYLK